MTAVEGPDSDERPRDRLAALLAAGRLDLPDPGCGSTAERHLALLDMARRHDVGVGRLVEAHCDAVSILREARAVPVPGSLYGVWASASGPDEPVLDSGQVTGTKRFCTGLGIVDHAVMDATTPDGERVLIHLDVSAAPSVQFDLDLWTTSALQDTATGDVTFRQHPVTAVVGRRDWYLQRPGFWHGACGPAACWAGAAIGLIDVARRLTGPNEHSRAHLGAMLAAQWSLTSLLRGAGRDIDDDPGNRCAAEYRARALRFTIERTCTDIADRFSRSLGPRPFVRDEGTAQRLGDLHLYLRQHHAERELAAIADLDREDLAS